MRMIAIQKRLFHETSNEGPHEEWRITVNRAKISSRNKLFF